MLFICGDSIDRGKHVRTVCAWPILPPCKGSRLHVNKAGRELFITQGGTDGLSIVVRPVIDKLKSL